MSNTLALSAVAQFAQACAPAAPDRRALRAALRELEDAAYAFGRWGDPPQADRYSTARASLYLMLGLSLEDLT